MQWLGHSICSTTRSYPLDFRLKYGAQVNSILCPRNCTMLYLIWNYIILSSEVIAQSQRAKLKFAKHITNVACCNAPDKMVHCDTAIEEEEAMVFRTKWK